MPLQQMHHKKKNPWKMTGVSGTIEEWKKLNDNDRRGTEDTERGHSGPVGGEVSVNIEPHRARCHSAATGGGSRGT